MTEGLCRGDGRDEKVEPAQEFAQCVDHLSPRRVRALNLNGGQPCAITYHLDKFLIDVACLVIPIRGIQFARIDRPPHTFPHGLGRVRPVRAILLNGPAHLDKGDERFFTDSLNLAIALGYTKVR
ncbi:Uncharacterised protein [Mycobacteroides abscessus subsp. abscessus]|nr:Uncharacterised protein [Mycobacteroides abscessus subsp. abscessus]